MFTARPSLSYYSERLCTTRIRVVRNADHEYSADILPIFMTRNYFMVGGLCICAHHRRPVSLGTYRRHILKYRHVMICTPWILLIRIPGFWFRTTDPNRALSRQRVIVSFFFDTGSSTLHPAQSNSEQHGPREKGNAYYVNPTTLGYRSFVSPSDGVKKLVSGSCREPAMV